MLEEKLPKFASNAQKSGVLYAMRKNSEARKQQTMHNFATVRTGGTSRDAGACEGKRDACPVSYTHLTLPTILLV